MINKISFSVVLLLSVIFTNAQDVKQNNYLDKVLTIDSTIETLYSVISGDKGVERNWELFRYLFKPEAKLIPSGKNSEGVIEVRFMTPDDYVTGSGKWLVENGFHEVNIANKVDIFGDIAQVFSSYESFRSKSDTEPFMRGINSIQLLNDGKRWWIVNIYWMQESEATPIPNTYLPNN